MFRNDKTMGPGLLVTIVRAFLGHLVGPGDDVGVWTAGGAWRTVECIGPTMHGTAHGCRSHRVVNNSIDACRREKRCARYCDVALAPRLWHARTDTQLACIASGSALHSRLMEYSSSSCCCCPIQVANGQASIEGFLLFFIPTSLSALAEHPFRNHVRAHTQGRVGGVGRPSSRGSSCLFSCCTDADSPLASPTSDPRTPRRTRSGIPSPSSARHAGRRTRTRSP